MEPVHARGKENGTESLACWLCNGIDGGGNRLVCTVAVFLLPDGTVNFVNTWVHGQVTGKGGAVLKTRLLVLETAGTKLDSCLSAKLSRA